MEKPDKKENKIYEVTIRLSEKESKKLDEKSEAIGLKPTAYTKMALVKEMNRD